jgi:hypothetical protein
MLFGIAINSAKLTLDQEAAITAIERNAITSGQAELALQRRLIHA